MAGTVKLMTMTLCIVNLLAAVYLTGVVLAPLYHHVKDSGETVFRRNPQIIGSEGEFQPLIDQVNQLEIGSRRNNHKVDFENEILEEAAQEEERGKAAMEAAKKRTTIVKDVAAAIAKELPAECKAEPHVDYDGVAVAWGLTHLKESAGDCCQACLDHRRKAAAEDKACNVWVYCPHEEGCFSPDIYDHKHKECWLKSAEKPKINFQGAYPEVYRQEHKQAPEQVEWMGGVV